MARQRPIVRSEPLPSWSQRLAALKHVPPLIRLVFQTHRGYTVAILALRAIRSLIPVAVLWVGKLIIDGVIAAVAIVQSGQVGGRIGGTSPDSSGWSWESRWPVRGWRGSPRCSRACSAICSPIDSVSG